MDNVNGTSLRAIPLFTALRHSDVADRSKCCYPKRPALVLRDRPTPTNNMPHPSLQRQQPVMKLMFGAGACLAPVQRIDENVNIGRFP